MNRFLRATNDCLLMIQLGMSWTVVSAQEPTCDLFDSWIWAQTVFEGSEQSYSSSLDADGNGTACDELRAVTGFAPATWVDQIPQGLIQGQVIGVADGDTLDIVVHGVAENVRLYRVDTPETYFTPQCGGDTAKAFTEWALEFNDQPGTVWIEQDATLRDPSQRLLAYVWFAVDGLPYLLNELLIRAGMGSDVNYGDNLYDQHMRQAGEFAERHHLGVYEECGGFGLPELQPDVNVPTSEPGQNYDCDPAYPDVCIPDHSFFSDLDCENVPHRRFTVLQPNDPYGFDADNNRVGCESYDTPYVGLP